METLKITQVTHAFPPYHGGLSHVVEMLSKNLVAQGHEVEVVTLDPSAKLKKSEYLEGVKVKRFYGIAPSNCYFVPSPTAISYLRSVRADVIHAHNIGALLVPAYWLAIRNKIDDFSFVLSPHHHLAGSTWHTKLFWKPYGPLARRIVQSARIVHCVSKYEAKLVKEKFGANSIVIQNGVAEDTFQCSWNPPSDCLVLTYAGRLEKYKRVHNIIKAAAILLRLGHKVSVRIIGEGPELQPILRLSSRLGVAVQHYDFLPRKDYLELLSTSSYFVNPSRYEAFSIVTAEARTIGLPAIVSRPWGEIFENSNNVLLVNGDSPSEIAQAATKTTKSQSREPYTFMSWGDVTKRLIREAYVPSLIERNQETRH